MAGVVAREWEWFWKYSVGSVARGARGAGLCRWVEDVGAEVLVCAKEISDVGTKEVNGVLEKGQMAANVFGGRLWKVVRLRKIGGWRLAKELGGVVAG